MSLLAFGIAAFIAVALTCTMFATRNMLLGFPCVMFWGILGGFFYKQYVTFGDLYYLLFIACDIGMTIFCAIGMYALRDRDLSPKKSDWLDSGKFFDEEKRDPGIDAPEENYMREEGGLDDNASRKSGHSSSGVRQRATDRRSGKRKRGGWGMFG